MKSIMIGIANSENDMWETRLLGTFDNDRVNDIIDQIYKDFGHKQYSSINNPDMYNIRNIDDIIWLLDDNKYELHIIDVVKNMYERYGHWN